MPGDADVEVPLGGGNWTAGVVRVGDTVRRPASAASPFVARLLKHLDRAGFDGCPTYLGSDAAGRDVLSFVPGEVTTRWQRYADEPVYAAGVLLRRLHDASRGLAADLGGQVVCHHDAAPNNAVFRDGVPVAFIDFDFAAVGDPIEDVAYAAWSWCISSRPDRGPVTEQARQVRLLADAYGLTPADRHRLVAAIDVRLRRNESFWLGADHPRAAEYVAWTGRELAFVRAGATVFGAALRS